MGLSRGIDVPVKSVEVHNCVIIVKEGGKKEKREDIKLKFKGEVQ